MAGYGWKAQRARHEKVAVPRHRVLSRGTVDRLERALEKRVRQDARRAVAEGLAAADEE